MLIRIKLRSSIRIDVNFAKCISRHISRERRVSEVKKYSHSRFVFIESSGARGRPARARKRTDNDAVGVSVTALPRPSPLIPAAGRRCTACNECFSTRTTRCRGLVRAGRQTRAARGARGPKPARGKSNEATRSREGRGPTPLALPTGLDANSRRVPSSDITYQPTY
ncbi:unnamed protein product [Euphydryas editha]|uniref:Uncharacterized protein n=1 Tax=Euphydryas editha TaxID=104508 RepID=A0AAU9VBC6_EUPED|nr:unnamed protein product [Euphydryas editha]